MQSQPASRSVRLKLPPGNEGGFRRSLEGISEFKVKDLADDWVEVEPVEGPGATRPYFKAHRLADAGTDLSDAAAWERVRAYPPYPGKPEIELPPELQKVMMGLRARDDIAGVVQRLGALASQADVEALPGLLQQELPGLFERYPQGSLWYVSVEPVLVGRLAFLRVSTQLRLTPDVDYDPDTRDSVRYFGLHTTTGGVDFAAAVDHVMLAIPPMALGFNIGVYPHVLVFLFGEFEDLRLREAQPLASTFYPRVNRLPSMPGIKFPVERLPTVRFEELLQWSTTRLNVLYGYATDPTNFSEANVHDPVAQAAWLFTLERMMADASALLAGLNAPPLLRMQAAFDLLDKADSLLTRSGKEADGRYFKHLLRRSEALPRLDRAFEQLPVQLRDRFKAWAQTSYDRLYSDIEESTMQKRRKHGGVEVAFSDPATTQLVPWDEYVPALMRAARNSSHGLRASFALRPPRHPGRTPGSSSRRTTARCPTPSTRS